MSDFDHNPSAAPVPPPPAPPQAPFGAPGAPPPPAAYPAQGFPGQGFPGQGGYPPQGYAPMGAMAQKPPRPAVAVGSGLLILGGIMLIAGSFLNWFSLFGEKYTGFSGSGGDTKDGPVFVFFGVLALGFGISQLLARKVLAVGILAIVFAAFAVLAALADLSDVSDAMDLAESIDATASQGPGLWVILIGSLLALAGGIATVAKRRR
ncbi:MAG: hypothetical protein WCC60_16280 [Ilumatobacteraceae bacterium]